MTQEHETSPPGWTRPERIDKIAAAGSPAALPPPATPDDVVGILDKVLVTGALGRIPKHRRHRDIVLAVLCANLRRRHPYTEVEINACLRCSLAHLRATVDHVTCRRYLVDLGFLKRNRAGTRYLLSYSRFAATLSAEAASTIGGLVNDALARSRRPGSSVSREENAP